SSAVPRPGCFTSADGSVSTVSSVQASVMTATTTRAPRQPMVSALKPEERRPSIPPTVLPATIAPTAAATPLDPSCSTRYAAATPGKPAIAMPCSARRTSSTEYDGASGSNSPSTTDEMTDTMITGRLPVSSDSAAIGSTVIASAPVATLTASDAPPGSRWYWAASCGRTGCGAYSNA